MDIACNVITKIKPWTFLSKLVGGVMLWSPIELILQGVGLLRGDTDMRQGFDVCQGV